MTLVQHEPFDLIDPTDMPPWWHPEVPPGWVLPESGDFPHSQDKALIEEEVPDAR